MSAKDVIVMKIRMMEADLKFLDWVWTELDEKTKTKLVNNFKGDVPSKYTK